MDRVASATTASSVVILFAVLEHHRLFSLEKKRSNVKDSDNRDFHIIILILRLTHTPEAARTAKVVSTEGEMFIVNVTECFFSTDTVGDANYFL